MSRLPPGWSCDKCITDGKASRRGCHGFDLSDTDQAAKLTGLLKDYPETLHNYIKACPYSYITRELNNRRVTLPEYAVWTRAYSLYDKGILPESGGMNDQPAILLDVIGVCESTVGHIMELEHAQRKRN